MEYSAPTWSGCPVTSSNHISASISSTSSSELSSTFIDISSLISTRLEGVACADIGVANRAKLKRVSFNDIENQGGWLYSSDPRSSGWGGHRRWTKDGPNSPYQNRITASHNGHQSNKWSQRLPITYSGSYGYLTLQTNLENGPGYIRWFRYY